MRCLKIFLLVVFIAGPTAHADEPPSWQPFSICSENQCFRAEIMPVITSDDPWAVEWIISVSELDSGEMLWSSSYLHDGYADGILSEDGRTFVYVNFWYYADSSVVTIYCAEERHTLEGKAFGIAHWQLEKTVSHHLWLTHDQQPYEFVGSDQLRVITIDNRSHLVNLRTGELSDSD